MTIQEFAGRFRDPFLRNAVRFFIDSPGWPMVRFPMVALAGMMQAFLSCGVPIGGSQKVAFQVADLYKELGGEIRFKSRVSDVIVENDQTAGIRIEDGTEHRADIVVWAGVCFG
jgi:phytoene dehydrogenase-like protein